MQEEIPLKERILEQLNDLPREQAEELRDKIEHMGPEEFENFVREFTVPLQACIFCQIAQGKIPTIKIYESKNILAILDINPVARGHMLVMTKQHYQFLTQLPDALLAEIFSFVKYIIPAIVRTVKSQGVTINIFQGKEQTVPHFVVNIIPRFKDDKISFALKRQECSRDELENIATEMRKEAKAMAGLPEEKERKKATEIEENGENEAKSDVDEKEHAQERMGVEFPEEEVEKLFRGRIPY